MLIAVVTDRTEPKMQFVMSNVFQGFNLRMRYVVHFKLTMH